MVKTNRTQERNDSLNNCLTDIYDWMTRNNLNPNLAKIEIMLSPAGFDRGNPILDWPIGVGTQPETTEVVNNIGLVMDNGLSLEPQVNASTKRCFFLLRLVYLSFVRKAWHQTLKIKSINLEKDVINAKRGSRLLIPCRYEMENGAHPSELQVEWGVVKAFNRWYSPVIRVLDSFVEPLPEPNSYADRAQMFLSLIPRGNCSLVLNPIFMHDSGTYQVKMYFDGQLYEKSPTVRVQVIKNEEEKDGMGMEKLKLPKLSKKLEGKDEFLPIDWYDDLPEKRIQNSIDRMYENMAEEREQLSKSKVSTKPKKRSPPTTVFVNYQLTEDDDTKTMSLKEAKELITKGKGMLPKKARKYDDDSKAPPFEWYEEVLERKVEPNEEGGPEERDEIVKIWKTPKPKKRKQYIEVDDDEPKTVSVKETKEVSEKFVPTKRMVKVKDEFPPPDWYDDLQEEREQTVKVTKPFTKPKKNNQRSEVTVDYRLLTEDDSKTFPSKDLSETIFLEKVSKLKKDHDSMWDDEERVQALDPYEDQSEKRVQSSIYRLEELMSEVGKSTTKPGNIIPHIPTVVDYKLMQEEKFKPRPIKEEKGEASGYSQTTASGWAQSFPNKKKQGLEAQADYPNADSFDIETSDSTSPTQASKKPPAVPIMTVAYVSLTLAVLSFVGCVIGSIAWYVDLSCLFIHYCVVSPDVLPKPI
ncbi:uncharacterized protein [Ambystoma mexicanum]|uniref:uncharacterized protein n=1 Tax=Ambystoma mexicanum TaxID=8296 RepID=UPI0037E7F10F